MFRNITNVDFSGRFHPQNNSHNCKKYLTSNPVCHELQLLLLQSLSFSFNLLIVTFPYSYLSIIQFTLNLVVSQSQLFVFIWSSFIRPFGLPVCISQLCGVFRRRLYFHPSFAATSFVFVDCSYLLQPTFQTILLV